MISLAQLAFQYRTGQPLFQDLTLDIPNGRIVGILGANGIGKTTLMRLMCGLISPTQGHLRIAGFTPRQRKTEFLRQLYLVPEESELPALSGNKYVKTFAPFYPDFSVNRYQAMVKQFEIDDHQNLQTLSLGQKKKFLVAFALATQCPVILMDEPTNGLDIPAKAQFRDMIIQHQSEAQTFLISTHQVRDLESVIDSVVMMNSHHAHWFDLGELSEFIAQVSEVAANDTVLYSEARLGVNQSIIAGRKPLPTEIDLELLFNTFHSNYDGLLAAVHAGAEL